MDLSPEERGRKHALEDVRLGKANLEERLAALEAEGRGTSADAGLARWLIARYEKVLA